MGLSACFSFFFTFLDALHFNTHLQLFSRFWMLCTTNDEQW